jgi:hypothetical protein
LFLSKHLPPLLFLAAAPVALAQVDAGVECARRCVDADTLEYCDNGAPTTLACDEATVPGVVACGTIGGAWGDDCLLGEGAACDPGYGGGASRCDRSASLFCIDDVCTVADGPPPPPGPLEPSPGTTPPDTASSSDPFGCSGCSGDSSTAFVGAAALLLLRRRRLLASLPLRFPR